MRGRFEWFVGLRYLMTRRRHAFVSLITFLAVAGVTVGVATLITVIAVMSGTETDLQNKILGAQAHVMVLRHGGPMAAHRQVIERIRGMTEGLRAQPFILSQGMLRSAEGMAGAVLRGVPAEDLAGLDPGAGEAVITRLPLPGVVLGTRLAETLRLGVGDQVFALVRGQTDGTLDQRPSVHRLQVTGLFASGLADIDKSFAVLELTAAQEMLGLGDGVSGVEIRLEDPFRAPVVAEHLRNGLGFPYWTTEWTRRHRNIFAALKLQKSVMFIIFSLIVLVAGFSITSALIMLVIEKRRDIAVLKTMGAGTGAIRRIFLIAGLGIAGLGSLLGVIGGVTLCALLARYQFVEIPADVYYFERLPVSLEMLDLTLIVAATLAICLVASVYPAHRAARVHPVEALRDR